MEIISNNQVDDSKLVITKLAPAVKNQNRVNVFVNNEYSFSLDIAQVVDYKVKVGQIVTPADIQKYQQASEFGKLYQRTLEWVLLRPRSIKETKDHLETKLYRRISENRLAEKLISEKNKKDKKYDAHHKKSPKVLPVFTKDDIENIISRLTQKGYLDDRKFAEFYVENRFVKKGISKKRLQLELLKKGISQDIINDVFIENQRTDLDEIKKIATKKYRRYSSEKLIAYLVRQGFDFQLSQDVVREMDSQNPERNLFS